MRCKIVRFQKLIWRNMMRSTKSQKALVLYYSIDKNLDRDTFRGFFKRLFICGLGFRGPQSWASFGLGVK